MQPEKTGALIRALRITNGMTQKELAKAIHLSDKAVSKWERGLGLPDIGVLELLSAALDVSIETLLDGDLTQNGFLGGNMKQATYYVCPTCGNVSMCTGAAEVSCCGRKLPALTAQKADGADKLTAEPVENEWYITSTHPMCKDNYISFVALVTAERLQLAKQYPEWDLQVRFPHRGHGMLLWYSTEKGLFYQPL